MRYLCIICVVLGIIGMQTLLWSYTTLGRFQWFLVLEAVLLLNTLIGLILLHPKRRTIPIIYGYILFVCISIGSVCLIVF